LCLTRLALATMISRTKEETTTMLRRLTEAAPLLRLDTDSAALEQYGRDWVAMYSPAPLAVAFPADIEQLQQLVKFAGENRLPLVPSGGRTGLSGGASASNNELVVSLERMNQIVDFDPVDQLVTVQAGVITQNLQEFAEQKGLYYPVDFASKGSSQIGGNIATNAGGVKVIRYGLTRDYVAGLKVITGQGELLELNFGLVKNATGYDLRHLFIGSEGTLGFIVEATIKLIAAPAPQQVMLLAADRMSDVSALLPVAAQRLSVSAFEFFSKLALEKVLQRHQWSAPLDSNPEFIVLIEYDCTDQADEQDALQLFETAVDEGWVTDGVVSQSGEQAQQFWRFREDITEAISPSEPYKNDISVRPSQTGAFLTELDTLIRERYPNFEVVWFGHIGDGNLHLSVLKPGSMSREAFADNCAIVNRLVFELVRKYRGSISAEHGVGRLKQPYLEFSRADQEIELMRQIKAVFDPVGIMNPGKLLGVQ